MKAWNRRKEKVMERREREVFVLLPLRKRCTVTDGRKMLPCCPATFSPVGLEAFPASTT